MNFQVTLESTPKGKLKMEDWRSESLTLRKSKMKLKDFADMTTCFLALEQRERMLDLLFVLIIMILCRMPLCILTMTLM